VKTSPLYLPGRSAGFSLVEVTIAIGIFAFVVVGVLGLLPTAMRMRADSAAETRGVLISEELFAAVRASPNLASVEVRDGPGLQQRNNQMVNLLSPAGETVVIGYPSQTTVPYFLWGGERADVGSPDSAWVQGQMPPGAVNNAIGTLARLSATEVGGGLYRVTVEVRAPASVPLANTRPSTFTTLVYSP
jgi:type II secretory pathway pseudopilin PulG